MVRYNFLHTPQKVPIVHTKYRIIKTKIPVPESIPLLKWLQRYESRSMHGQLPVVWDKAEDFLVFDKYGNRWIDFTSTIFVTNCGHSNPKIISALKQKLNHKLLHTYTFAHETRARFLKKLINITPSVFQKAFLLSAGTEATECALKLTRMYGQQIRPSKKIIVSFDGCMHGRTMGAEMLKGDPKTSSWIGYMDPNIYRLRVPFPWLITARTNAGYDWGRHFNEDIKRLRTKGVHYNDIAGFILESYVGWSGYFYPVEYIQTLAAFAKRYDSLLVFDDIQGGFGRTGKLFAYQHYKVNPDLICLGKGLSAALPLSAVIGRRQIMDLPDVGSMSSTHSANPLCCAAGLATLQAIEEDNLIAESARKGRILHARLQEIKRRFSYRISYVFGKGLIAAIIFKNPQNQQSDILFPSRVCEKAMQKGLLLVHTGRESVKIGPPLTISDDALSEGLRVLEESILELDRKN